MDMQVARTSTASSKKGKGIRIFIATASTFYRGSYFCSAYGLLVSVGNKTGEYWGCYQYPIDAASMEMYAYKRLLSDLDEPEETPRFGVLLSSRYLAQRLDMAAKWKADVQAGKYGHTKKMYRDDWMETATLHDVYRPGMREGRTKDEKSMTRLAKKLAKSKLFYGNSKPRSAWVDDGKIISFDP